MMRSPENEPGVLQSLVLHTVRIAGRDCITRQRGTAKNISIRDLQLRGKKTPKRWVFAGRERRNRKLPSAIVNIQIVALEKLVVEQNAGAAEASALLPLFCHCSAAWLMLLGSVPVRSAHHPLRSEGIMRGVVEGGEGWERYWRGATT